MSFDGLPTNAAAAGYDTIPSAYNPSSCCAIHKGCEAAYVDTAARHINVSSGGCVASVAPAGVGSASVESAPQPGSFIVAIRPQQHVHGGQHQRAQAVDRARQGRRLCRIHRGSRAQRDHREAGVLRVGQWRRLGDLRRHLRTGDIAATRLRGFETLQARYV